MADVSKFTQEVLNQMEERGFTQGEAELLPRMLENSLKENSKRFDYYKPFTVFRFPTDCNDQ